MCRLFLIAATLVVASANLELFEQFRTQYGKDYKTKEEQDTRFEIFKTNLLRAEELNNEGHATFGVTKFMDLSAAEFKATYLARKSLTKHKTMPEFDHTECPACKLFPEMGNYTANALDWTTKGAVTPVKDQGQCGSCWSFGTTGDIEGVYFLSNGTLPGNGKGLSEQQLVACDTSQDEGCNGGLQEDAFDYVIKNKGLTTEENYPYTSGSGKRGICAEAKSKEQLSGAISSWAQVSKTAAGESGIASAMVKAGPVTIAINAEHLQTYKSGITNPLICRSGEAALDHAVLMVGYGTDGGDAYWKIKNSWAADWGEEGYFRIVSGTNKCGIAMDAVHSKL
jgi:C1A family cysteine protease